MRISCNSIRYLSEVGESEEEIWVELQCRGAPPVVLCVHTRVGEVAVGDALGLDGSGGGGALVRRRRR